MSCLTICPRWFAAAGLMFSMGVVGCAREATTPPTEDIVVVEEEPVAVVPVVEVPPEPAPPKSDSPTPPSADEDEMASDAASATPELTTEPAAPSEPPAASGEAMSAPADPMPTPVTEPGSPAASEAASSAEIEKPKPATTDLADASSAMKAEAVPAQADAASKGGDGKPVTTGDWAMWGGSLDRNMVNAATGIDLSFEPGTTSEEGKNLLWTSPLGSQTYGNPVVADGKVFVGTNNGGVYRKQHVGDRGILLCFDEADGKFLWQLTREKLPQGRVNDWPEQGICSTACVEGKFVYAVTNRCELMCLDTEGFRDGENDGAVQDEVDHDPEDADIVWKLDMIGDLDVFPHNLATSSPLILGDNVYVVTSNGVDEAHLEIPSPRAPSFLCVNKTTGEIVWEDNSPFDKILHGQWSSPSVGEVNGQKQIYFPGGDGWLYAFDPAGDGDGGGKVLWKFDCNPKDSSWELGGRGTRNNIIATPCFAENSVVIAVGQDPEHGEGVGHLYRIDATKEGDVSPQIADDNGGWKANPNSGQVWQWGGEDTDGSITGRKGELLFRRTICTAGVKDGLVIAADLSGFVHCLDFATGKRYWEHDMFAACWGSPMIVDGKVFIGDEDGELTVLDFGKEEKELEVKSFNSSIYSTPTFAHGKMFVSDRSRLYCFKVQ